jgi:hypothetical protein
VIEAPYCPALLRNLDVGGVKVHTTGLCGVNCPGTRWHESKQQRCGGDNCKGDFHRNSLFASHHRIYICFAALRARVHPERLPCASYRLARAIVAENCAFRRSFAWCKDSGVGWRSSCAFTDWRAVNPANGLPDDWRMAASNCAISAVQGPA